MWRYIRICSVTSWPLRQTSWLSKHAQQYTRSCHTFLAMRPNCKELQWIMAGKSLMIKSISHPESSSKNWWIMVNFSWRNPASSAPETRSTSRDPRWNNEVPGKGLCQEWHHYPFLQIGSLPKQWRVVPRFAVASVYFSWNECRTGKALKQVCCGFYL